MSNIYLSYKDNSNDDVKIDLVYQQKFPLVCSTKNDFLFIQNIFKNTKAQVYVIGDKSIFNSFGNIKYKCKEEEFWQNLNCKPKRFLLNHSKRAYFDLLKFWKLTLKEKELFYHPIFKLCLYYDYDCDESDYWYGSEISIDDIIPKGNWTEVKYYSIDYFKSKLHKPFNYINTLKNLNLFFE